LLSDIGDRIAVLERLVNADTNFNDRIPLEEESADRDIRKEVANYFGERRGEIEALVQSTSND
jgi:hypothetical protein